MIEAEGLNKKESLGGLAPCAPSSHKHDLQIRPKQVEKIVFN